MIDTPFCPSCGADVEPHDQKCACTYESDDGFPSVAQLLREDVGAAWNNVNPSVIAQRVARALTPARREDGDGKEG